MQVSVFYLPSIGSRDEIEAGMAGAREDLYQKMLAELKEQAQQLRRDGLSMRAIENQLGIARSTVSSWVREIELSDRQRA